MFADDVRKPYRSQHFNISLGEEGSPMDRPLIVQFCANDPKKLLAAAKFLEPHCDAIDLNLGCPQDIAKRGRYGAFLQDDWELIYSLGAWKILTFAKVVLIRRSEHPPRELKCTSHGQVPHLQRCRKNYCLREDARKRRRTDPHLPRPAARTAGAEHRTSLPPSLCPGSPTRHRQGLADWAQIRAVKAAVSVPVFANGNVLYHSDLARCLADTGVDAVMCAEGQLYNAALFARADHAHGPPGALDASWSLGPTAPTPASSSTPSDAAAAAPDSAALPPGARGTPSETYDAGLHPPHADLALEYLSIVRALKTPTPWPALKGHIFKIMRPALTCEPDLREAFGRVRRDDLDGMEAAVREMKARMDVRARTLPFSTRHL